MFRDVIGQQAVKQHLVEMVQHNRLSHALLFLGKEGSGALPLARAFAQYVALLPLAKTPVETSLFGAPETLVLPATPDAADAWMEQQASFSKAQALVHPDIHFSYPVVPRKSGDKPISTDYAAEWRRFLEQSAYGNVYDWLQFIEAENRQGNISAQECNEIIRKLNLKSFESGYKVLVLWMPEYLNKEGNKLLKLIEEPPADTLFILVAENEGAILNTILSRCQLVKIPALDSADVTQALLQHTDADAATARSIAHVCEGNFREALQLLQHADEDFSRILREWLGATIRYNPVNQLKVIDEIARLGREKQKQLLRHFAHLMEQALRLEVLNESAQAQLMAALSPSDQDFTQRLNKAMDLAQKEVLAPLLDEAAYHIERNAHAKILFHALTIRMFHLIRNRVLVSV